MGTCCLSYPPMPPICFLVILVFLGISVNSVVGCNMEMCWKRHQDAQRAARLGILMELVPSGKFDSAECIVLRTYIKCIARLSKTPGCKSDIRFQYAKAGYRSKMRLKNCTSNGTVYEPGSLDIPEVPIDNLMCSYTGERKYRHCGLFGDPHLRTFNNEFQTCKVEGAWALINNKHLTVQVTNDPVVNSGAATATSKLTIVIKRDDDCAAKRFVTYAAQTDNLPSSFDDGQTTYGTEESVKLTEIEPNKYVRIYIRFIDTTILIRQIGRYFTFAIKMPEQVINGSREEDVLELCVQGCPIQERINYQKYLALKRNEIINATPSEDGSHGIVMSRKEGVDLCKSADVVDFYFDSCVFDLMTTGDKDFTASAYQAWQDLINLTPELRGSQTNRTDLTLYDNMHNNSAGRTTGLLLSFSEMLLLTLLLCALQNICKL